MSLLKIQSNIKIYFKPILKSNLNPLESK